MLASSTFSGGTSCRQQGHANFNKIHHPVSEQQLFKRWNSKTEVSSMENTD